ncbi:conserved hypothetical protein [Candidatus Sulfopaludibacter sp. SbA3]|nr:conserved hypothetical protein [Candidatus Sulfopaludibacter sp. SbA3]
MRPQDATAWRSGSGAWSDLGRWTFGVPTALQSAVVGGRGAVLVASGRHLAGDLKIGLDAGDNAGVEVNGGQLILTQDSLRVGEYTGSRGDFVLQRGALHCAMDVFVGAATAGPRRATHASLRIAGGSFLGRTLTVGQGFGAESLLAIDGSGASAADVLDYVYLEANGGDGGQAGLSTLFFTLDDHGVTPITIRSHRDGLRIIQDTASHVRLQIALRAVPPREDITLVSSHVRTRGTFDGLPEGSEIAAEYHGRTYRWMLTYRGGASACDLMLKNKSEYSAGDPVTHVRPIPEPPAPLWREHPLFPLSAQGGRPAFAGAEGFGAFTAGGRGGRIVYVDNLNDAGPGSLRAALATSGKRIVRFRVSGVIALASRLTIDQPFITIDGQSAPGDGITLRHHGIVVETHDVVLRYFRIRVGDQGVQLDDRTKQYEAGEGEDCVYFTGARDCIADHLSLSWSTSKILSTTKMSDRITIQWCILSEGLNFAGHAYTSIAGGNRVTWHHNLLAHNQSRNVRFQGTVDADFRNNVIYDWGDTAAYGEFDRVNYVGNYLKPGPSTTQRPPLFHNGDGFVFADALFVSGNVMHGSPEVSANNWLGMGYDAAGAAARQPFPAPPVTSETAAAAFDRVLNGAGATLPQRDSIDQRVIREVREGTGHIIQFVREVWAGGQ